MMCMNKDAPEKLIEYVRNPEEKVCLIEKHKVLLCRMMDTNDNKLELMMDTDDKIEPGVQYSHTEDLRQVCQ
jgi:hypothetical protein